MGPAVKQGYFFIVIELELIVSITEEWSEERIFEFSI